MKIFNPFAKKDNKEKDSAAGLMKALAKYIAIRENKKSLRQYVAVERGSEEKEQLKHFDRLEGVALGRNLERNNEIGRGLLLQLKINVAGEVKAKFNTGNEEWNKKANFLFNTVFARDCFYKFPMHIVEFFQLAESARTREGDLLICFDDFFDGKSGSGKMLVWDADQLVSVNENEWSNPEINPFWNSFSQESGVVTDRFGKVVAYIVSAKHIATRGNISLPFSDVLILSESKVRLVQNRWRFSQYRGTPELMIIDSPVRDVVDMIKSEQQTAKAGAQFLSVVSRNKESATAELELDVHKMLERMEDGGGSAAGEDVEVSEEKRKEYPNLDSATGGKTIYASDGDKVDFFSANRPNMNTTEFYKCRRGDAGASIGMASCYSSLAVSSSYTAHRGETNLTWRNFYDRQKKHEHYWLDWIAVKVISRFIEIGEIEQGEENWEYKVSWRMQKAPEIDPLKERSAIAKSIKIGEKTYQEILGPDWRERLEQLASEVDLIRSLGIPLEILETAAGGVVPGAENEEEKENEVVSDSE